MRFRKISGVNGHTCAANENNLYYGDLGALRCLQDRRADVAFIDLRGVPYGKKI